jgi:hypothetical protein
MNVEVEFSFRARAEDEEPSNRAGKRSSRPKPGQLSDLVNKFVSHPVVPIFIREWLRQG